MNVFSTIYYLCNVSALTIEQCIENQNNNKSNATLTFDRQSSSTLKFMILWYFCFVHSFSYFCFFFSRYLVVVCSISTKFVGMQFIASKFSSILNGFISPFIYLYTYKHQFTFSVKS